MTDWAGLPGNTLQTASAGKFQSPNSSIHLYFSREEDFHGNHN